MRRSLRLSRCKARSRCQFQSLCSCPSWWQGLRRFQIHLPSSGEEACRPRSGHLSHKSQCKALAVYRRCTRVHRWPCTFARRGIYNRAPSDRSGRRHSTRHRSLQCILCCRRPTNTSLQRSVKSPRDVVVRPCASRPHCSFVSDCQGHLRLRVVLGPAGGNGLVLRLVEAEAIFVFAARSRFARCHQAV